jgi:hypothetical protein
LNVFTKCPAKVVAEERARGFFLCLMFPTPTPNSRQSTLGTYR